MNDQHGHQQDQERDRIFFINYSIILGGLALMMVLFLVVALYIAQRNAFSREPLSQLSERTAPVGQVRVAEEAATSGVAGSPEASSPSSGAPSSGAPAQMAEVSALSGDQVYAKVCIACHGGAIPGIPALGDVAAWAPRLAKGLEILYGHAIDGYEGGASGLPMPARGGNADLSDEEVKAAVDYLLSQSKN